MALPSLSGGRFFLRNFVLRLNLALEATEGILY